MRGVRADGEEVLPVGVVVDSTGLFFFGSNSGPVRVPRFGRLRRRGRPVGGGPGERALAGARRAVAPPSPRRRADGARARAPRSCRTSSATQLSKAPPLAALSGVSRDRAGSKRTRHDKSGAAPTRLVGAAARPRLRRRRAGQSRHEHGGGGAQSRTAADAPLDARRTGSCSRRRPGASEVARGKRRQLGRGTRSSFSSREREGDDTGRRVRRMIRAASRGLVRRPRSWHRALPPRR